MTPGEPNLEDIVGVFILLQLGGNSLASLHYFN